MKTTYHAIWIALLFFIIGYLFAIFRVNIETEINFKTGDIHRTLNLWPFSRLIKEQRLQFSKLFCGSIPRPDDYRLANREKLVGWSSATKANHALFAQDELVRLCELIPDLTEGDRSDIARQYFDVLNRDGPEAAFNAATEMFSQYIDKYYDDSIFFLQHKDVIGTSPVVSANPTSPVSQADGTPPPDR